MRGLIAALAASAVTGCISASPLELPDAHPASPKAPSGLIGTSTTLEGYKSADDFAARAAQEPAAPSGGHAQHGGHAGMRHGGAPAQPAPHR